MANLPKWILSRVSSSSLAATTRPPSGSPRCSRRPDRHFCRGRHESSKSYALMMLGNCYGPRLLQRGISHDSARFGGRVDRRSGSFYQRRRSPMRIPANLTYREVSNLQFTSFTCLNDSRLLAQVTVVGNAIAVYP